MEMSHQEKLAFKKTLHAGLVAKLRNNIAELKGSIFELQDSAKSESKSSVGDKYETGRAMIQLEIEKITEQLREKETALGVISAMQVDVQDDTIRRGAVIITSEGTYFLSLSAGTVVIDHITVSCISSSSPLGQMLLGRKSGDRVLINKREVLVEKFF